MPHLSMYLYSSNGSSTQPHIAADSGNNAWCDCDSISTYIALRYVHMCVDIASEKNIISQHRVTKRIHASHWMDCVVRAFYTERTAVTKSKAQRNSSDFCFQSMLFLCWGRIVDDRNYSVSLFRCVFCVHYFWFFGFLNKIVRNSFVYLFC